MPAKAFLDTNVLLYAIARGDPRNTKAEALLASGGVVSVQVLNEFASVARRKLQMPWNELREAVDSFLVLCPSPVPLTLELHKEGFKIAQGHSYNFYDALIIAAALQAGCTTVYSEDLHHGQVINCQLTIRNPFL